MANRTDLALESYEEQEKTEIDGVKVRETNGISVVEVLNENGSNILGKPIGKYITLSVPSIINDTDIFDGRIDRVVDVLRPLLTKDFSKTILVAGVGNSSITADALGPRVNNFVLATRHITDELKKQIGLESLKSVSTVTTGVLGETGIESAEIIKGVSDSINPSCVIVVDALAASSVHRLGTTIQISDTGISPGSGVGNHRFEISKKTLGVPVVSIGIPTVVDTSTIARELGTNTNEEQSVSLFVTPREIDQVIEQGAKLIGMSINCAIQSEMSPEDLFALAQ